MMPRELLEEVVEEVDYLSTTNTGREAAKARAEWSEHMRACPTCAPASKAQEKAPRGKYILFPDCAESDRLMACANEAEKTHSNSEKRRKELLPLLARALREAYAGRDFLHCKVADTGWSPETRWWIMVKGECFPGIPKTNFETMIAVKHPRFNKGDEVLIEVRPVDGDGGDK